MAGRPSSIIAAALGLSTVGGGQRDWTVVPVSLAALCYGFLAALRSW